jgi:3-oxoacyl-[acyl-carrier-protein] synthase II
MARRVVITSMGVISSLGDDTQAIARSIREGLTSFRRSADDPGLVIAPIDNFDVRRYTGRFKNLRYLNRGAALAVAAALQAVSGAGLTAQMAGRCGLFVGSGPNLDFSRELPGMPRGHMDSETLAALWMLRFLPNTAASVIAQLVGLHGENLTAGTACAASLQAIGEAFRKIRDGYLDCALAGGGDSRLNPGGLLAYQKAQALFEGAGEPEHASRPFDLEHRGFVPGEGGAFFILESFDQARQRQAPILAEVLGYSASMDGYNMTAPEPGGRWAQQAVSVAINQSGLQPAHIEAISAHGTSTPLNDTVEAHLIERMFNGCQPLVLALKSWIGHTASACGAMELGLCLVGMLTGTWAGIRNLDAPCHSHLNYLRPGISACPGTVLLQNFGFGGQNAALVIQSWTE